MDDSRPDFNHLLLQFEKEFKEEKESMLHKIRYSFNPKPNKKIKQLLVTVYACPISYEEKEYLIKKIKQLHEQETFYGDYFSVKIKHLKLESKFLIKIRAKKFLRIGDVNFYS